MNHTFDFSNAGKFRKMSPELSAARFRLLDRVIETEAPLSLAEAEELTGGKELLTGLLQGRYVQEDEEGQISYLYPVSAQPTGHRVRLADGREFHTMCAVDSLGCASTFGMDFEIFSYCKDSGAPVYLKVENGAIARAEPGHDLYVSYYDSWLDGSFNF